MGSEIEAGLCIRFDVILDAAQPAARVRICLIPRNRFCPSEGIPQTGSHKHLRIAFNGEYRDAHPSGDPHESAEPAWMAQLLLVDHQADEQSSDIEMESPPEGMRRVS
jgi:hypothetical protein